MTSIRYANMRIVEDAPIPYKRAGDSSGELAASRSVESAYQQKVAREVLQVKQEQDSVRLRLAELEQRPAAS
jgi:hypothetical protein